jgi:hypothetical protein
MGQSEHIGEVVLVRNVKMFDRLGSALNSLGIKPGEAFSVRRCESLTLKAIAEHQDDERGHDAE